MGRSSHWRWYALVPVVILGTIWPWERAAADSFGVLYQPSYVGTSSSVTDQVGNVSHLDSNLFQQRFQLTLDKSIYPLLKLFGAGTYDLGLSSSSTDNVPPGETAAQRWNATLILTVGDPVLSGTVGFYSLGSTADFMTRGVRTSTPTFISNTLQATTSWRPDGLPQLFLQAQQTDTFDTGRVLADRTSSDASLQFVYDPFSTLSLRYRLQYDHPVNNLSGVASTTFLQRGIASYGQGFLDNLLSIYASYNFTSQNSEFTTRSPGSIVTIQEYPIAGLSTIQVFPATSTRVALSPNPALIDGDSVVSAGVNIGFGPSLSGDTAYRDVGVRFVDPPPSVNLVYVWVDRLLPPAVAGAYTWTAYRSDDNLNWSLVVTTGPVVFGTLQNRFEIPIEATQARYLKVVTRPLVPQVTADRGFADVFVTEVQVFRGEVATSGKRSSFAGAYNALLRFQIIRSRLIYDFSLSGTHAGSLVTYAMVNGLTFNQGLGPILTFNARAQRTDGKDPTGTLDQTLWMASLDAQFFPTLGASATYNGEYLRGTADASSPLGSGQNLRNDLGFFLRATPYTGIGLVASLTLANNQAASGRRLQATTTTVQATITPNPILTLTGSWLSGTSNLAGGGLPDTSERTQRVEGTVAVQPLSTLAASASISYLLLGGTPQTLTNVTASFSPFPDGNLIFNFRYSNSYDSLAQARSEIFGPYLRWTVTPRIWLEGSYTWLDTFSPVQASYNRSLLARLTLWL